MVFNGLCTHTGAVGHGVQWLMYSHWGSGTWCSTAYVLTLGQRDLYYKIIDHFYQETTEIEG